MKFNAKQIFLFLGVMLIAGIFYWSQQKRDLASDESQQAKAESAQMKSNMIQSIEWMDHGGRMSFLMALKDSEFCNQWQHAKIHLVADGMGVSGEAPGAVASMSCQDGKFEMMWPKRIAEWSEGIQKTGDYIEEPHQFYIGLIEVDGLAGTMKITNYEISAILGQNLELVME